MPTRKWILFLIQTIITSASGSQGSGYTCGSSNPVAHICNSSTVTMASNAFVYFSSLQAQNGTACSCSVSPISSNMKIHLRYRSITESTKNIRFKFNGMVLNETRKSANTSLSETMALKLETTPVFGQIETACLLLQTAPDGKLLNISCETSTYEVSETSTYEVSETSTDEVSETSTYEVSETSTYVVSPSAKPITLVTKEAFASDKDDDTTMTGVTIGVAIGGAVIVIVLVIVAIVIYRKRTATKKKTNIECTSKKDDVKAAKVDGDESDYYMTENPLYNTTESATVTTETPYYAQVNKTARVVQDVEDNDTTPITGVYNVIPDSPNDVSEPLMSTHEKNLNDTKKFIDTECEYTEIGHVEDITISKPIG